GRVVGIVFERQGAHGRRHIGCRLVNGEAGDALELVRRNHADRVPAHDLGADAHADAATDALVPAVLHGLDDAVGVGALGQDLDAVHGAERHAALAARAAVLVVQGDLRRAPLLVGVLIGDVGHVPVIFPFG